LPKPHVIVYSRPGCHLCEEAKLVITSSLANNNVFTFEEIDVDSDPVLTARYGFDIPVILINGIEVFKHRLRAAEFEQALRDLG
jgi:glutaredoxin